MEVKTKQERVNLMIVTPKYEHFIFLTVTTYGFPCL